jgi:hypothetical protein
MAAPPQAPPRPRRGGGSTRHTQRRRTKGLTSPSGALVIARGTQQAVAAPSRPAGGMVFDRW